MRAASKGKAKRAEAKIEADEILPTSSSATLIFISHDSRDAELAEAFSKLLSSVSAGVLKSFRSSDKRGTQGIEYGVEWFPELMNKLNAASDVVCLLTQRSLDRPWILYEAGVAKGKLETPVYGIALGIPLSRANTGPFAQFQNSDDNEDSLTKLVIQLVKRIPNAEPDRDAVVMQVRTFKDKSSEILTRLDASKGEASEPPVAETSVAKLFEEVKVMFQDLPSRVEGRLDPDRHLRHRYMHPMYIDELMHISTESDDPIWILMAISTFRDELPWLYELGLEAYRAIKNGDPEEIERAIRSIHVAVDFARRGPLLKSVRSKYTYMMVRELPVFLERFLTSPAPAIKSLKSPKKSDKASSE